MADDPDKFLPYFKDRKMNRDQKHGALMQRNFKQMLKGNIASGPNDGQDLRDSRIYRSGRSGGTTHHLYHYKARS